MKKIKYLFKYKKVGMYFVIFSFVCSIASFIQVFNYRLAFSKILSFLSGVLFLAGSIYSLCYYLKDLKNN